MKNFQASESPVIQQQQMPDSRVACCLHFVSPTGHGLKPLNIEFIQRLYDKLNIIPIIAKADTMTPDKSAHFKKRESLFTLKLKIIFLFI